MIGDDCGVHDVVECTLCAVVCQCHESAASRDAQPAIAGAFCLLDDQWFVVLIALRCERLQKSSQCLVRDDILSAWRCC